MRKKTFEKISKLIDEKIDTEFLCRGLEEGVSIIRKVTKEELEKHDNYQGSHRYLHKIIGALLDYLKVTVDLKPIYREIPATQEEVDKIILIVPLRQTKKEAKKKEKR